MRTRGMSSYQMAFSAGYKRPCVHQRQQKIMKYSAAPTQTESSDREDRIIKTKHGNKRSMKTRQSAYTASNRKQGNGNFIYIKLSLRKNGVSLPRYAAFGTLVYTEQRDGSIGIKISRLLIFLNISHLIISLKIISLYLHNFPFGH